MGLKELIADVTLSATDLNLDIGVWWAGKFTANHTTIATFTCTSAVTIIDAIVQVTAAGSNTVTINCGTTANTDALMACTVSTAGSFRMIGGTTAPVVYAQITAVTAAPVTASLSACTAGVGSFSAITTQNTILTELASGASIVFTCSVSDSTTLAGKGFVCYIKTPT